MTHIALQVHKVPYSQPSLDMAQFNLSIPSKDWFQVRQHPIVGGCLRLIKKYIAQCRVLKF